MRLEVFDPAMCCSTGVCGSEIDPRLAQFAADLAWLSAEGVEVVRYNLAQEPGAFVSNSLVQSTLHAAGSGALPLLLLDGEVISRGSYPDREKLAGWVGRTIPSETVPRLSLKVLNQ